MQLNRFIFVFGIAIFTVHQVGAQSKGATSNDLQLNSITTSMPFLSITPDSRAGSMGDAGTTLSAYASSIFWNTAMLSFAKEKSEIGLSYTPWLRKLTNDIHLTYLSGYHKLDDRQSVAASLRYFSLGEITYTGIDGGKLRDDKPSEFEIALGYSFKLSQFQSLGVNGKFAYSNLTGGLPIPGANTKAGIAGMTDVSYVYRKDDLKIKGYESIYTFGATINNIGNKISYSDLTRRDFLPQNLRLGNSLSLRLDEYNTFTYSLDLQKLLVPTPPIYAPGTTDIASGKNPDVGVIAAMMQSFYDAPGQLQRDDNGEFVKDGDSYVVVKNSKLKEELNEINIATGFEYLYNNVLSLRGGFYYENKSKGSRQFFTAGAGFQYNLFSVDLSYLAALERTNPLANTLRFSLRFTIK